MKLIIHAALLATGLLLTTRQVSAAEPVKVGIIMSTTGAYSFVGIPLANGIKLASEELVARKGAGDPEISWIFEDNRSDKQEFTVLMNRMVRADDVRLVIGPVSSYEALAASPVAVELQVPMFTTATSPETLMAGPYVFKSTENGPDIIAPLARYVADRLKPKSCYLVHIRDNNAYLIYSDIMRDVLQKAGIGIAAQDTVLTSESDFTALATKIVQSGADCLYLATPPEIGANIVVQSRQAGLPGSTVLVGNQNMNSPSYIKTGGSAVDGTYLAAEFDATSTSPLTKDFVTRYRAKYKTPPDNWAAMGYSMAMITADAIKRAGPMPTRQSVRDALAETRSFPVVLGKGTWSLDADRVPHFGSVILKIERGASVVASE